MNALNNTATPGWKASEFEAELNNILSYWSSTVFDEANGRFYPKVDHNDTPDRSAVAGAVMYARILWAFSAGYRHTGTPRYLKRADVAFQYIQQHFMDAEYGGIYWSVHPDGHPADTRKQMYALAFAIYGLAEYYKTTNNQTALTLAKGLYQAIEQHSWDSRYGGYVEALARDWSPTPHLSLSTKDDNEKKTLNTHLHILEAYTNLYGIWPNDTLKQRIATIITLFDKHFVNRHGHLTLFFDEQWQARSSLRSFGHEIEASWLLCKAARAVHGGQLPDTVRTLSLRLADASAKWIDQSGALLYEFDAATNTLVDEKHWWVQAEAVVGFYRAGLLSTYNDYLSTASRVWQYIKEHLIDHQHGEWYWGRDAANQIMTHEDKAGFWKCPYHNSRCCLQLIQLLNPSSMKTENK